MLTYEVKQVIMLIKCQTQILHKIKIITVAYRVLNTIYLQM